MKTYLAAAALAAALLTAPTASAQPPNCIGPPGATTTVWCGPTMPTGQHMRCQWMFLYNACDWRWDDDSPAPTP